MIFSSLITFNNICVYVHLHYVFIESNFYKIQKYEFNSKGKIYCVRN